MYHNFWIYLNLSLEIFMKIDLDKHWYKNFIELLIISETQFNQVIDKIVF